MSKRKGVSAEEKKTRMLQLFYERKEFFQLKDLEKIAPKEKGIIVNSVKDVVQSLVDEGLINTDKIGTSVYFWAFPSEAKNAKKRKLNELNEQYNERTKKLKAATESVAELQVGREDTAERNNLSYEIVELQLERDKLNNDLKKYKDNDPEVLGKLREEAQRLKEAANRWTDNIFSVKSWCTKKFNTESDVLDKQFGIPSDFDYIE
ncbi:hypothetical protein ILUMI_25594 [Ignelater luminosus]|uniref:Meiotic nuclear division protein 1 homolog n=1 Tax=Ignelater luminosus TaxID=2038154 RepID=A0A8K0C599_IGNLU|nr:hypothetical protein ILUMI_25594 [Ignelater luminosus]